MRNLYRQHSAIGRAIWTQLRDYALANTYRRMAVHVGDATNAERAVDAYREMGADMRIDVDEKLGVMDAMALVKEGNVVGQHWWMGKG